MNFWLKKSIIGAMLLAIAIYLLSNQSEIFSYFNELVTVQETVEQAPEEESSVAQSADNPEKKAEPTKPEPKEEEKVNAAAEGLSKFYARINGESEKAGMPRIIKNVVHLPSPKGSLDKILKDKAKVTRPLPRNWQSDKASRPFREGQTLFQKMTEYAEKEGLDVIWWLNRDLLIKSAFRINKDITRTAYQVGMALNGHFENGVYSYFCHKHRTIVFTDEPTSYLDKQCQRLKSKSGF